MISVDGWIELDWILSIENRYLELLAETIGDFPTDPMEFTPMFPFTV